MAQGIQGHNNQPIGAEVHAEAEDLRASTLEALDFDAVRQALVNYTTFFPARELALRLTPRYDLSEVEELQRETAEARILLELVGEVDLHTATDASLAISRAALEGVLTGSELLEVAGYLDVQRRASHTVLRTRDRVPFLAAMAQRIPDVNELRRQIKVSIGSGGEVADDATPSLRALRVQARQAYVHVTEALTRIIQSSVGHEALQDDVITLRGDRLVVQVKSERRHRIPGIVHDASNTGASLFIEPFATVELCNSWRELALEEQREAMRVLRDLSMLVGTLADDIHRGNEVVARLDFALTRARYSAALNGVSALPRRTSQQFEATRVLPDVTVRLLRARHPLLGEGAVPVTINIGPGWSTLVITGPNTGGKTVAMKTVGLLSLMHQSGIQIPADEGSILPVFDAIYADVGDQQSVQESVSTFSSHMRSVIDILSKAGPTSLVLLDELGTSTDPEEGSALAKAILDHMSSLGIPSIVTTHYRNVAAYAEAKPGMINASVQLDASTLRPNYLLVMGIPGKSYAMSVAASLRMPDEIMQEALTLVEPQHLRFEDWLSELQGEREKLQTSLEEAEQARAQAESIRGELDTQVEYLVSHREDILDSLRRDLLSQYGDIRQKLRRADAALSWDTPRTDVDARRGEVSRIKHELETYRMPAPVAPRRSNAPSIAAGDLVDVRGLNLRGTVESVMEQSREAEVRIGKVRLRMGLSRLARVDEDAETESAAVYVDLGPSLSSNELDIRGTRVEEGLVRERL